uniref:amino acid permease n=1 Tax=Rhodococcus qingshengii TaxID=334542 RepID=UPI001C4E13E4|nr:amino acid permease [Rhodococcus qingshengii]
MSTSSSPADLPQSPPSTVPTDRFVEEEDGYKKDLKPRQVQMIAVGGAIGTGLFLGAGGRLAGAGPSLAVVYAICGAIAFLVLRALGELVVHRPTSGSFVSYAREFYGEKAAFVAGWLYWLTWATTAIVDVTAVALYLNFFSRYSSLLAAIPQWIFALSALVAVMLLNAVGVRVFGELEFWFALIKVVALAAFLLTGIYLLLFGEPLQGDGKGLQLIADNGGLLPNGLLPAVVVVQGVIFAYASIELVGTAAGETANAEKVIPRAINTVILRIGIFYVGSVTLLALLLPYTAYDAGESPFVTFFSKLGVDGIDTIMNLVVITAAMSSLNAGLYTTGRTLRSMALAGSAPKIAARISSRGVPYGGILLTGLVTLIGVGLNAWVPSNAFEIVLNLSAIGTITAWATIVLCQIKLTAWARHGRAQRPTFRMMGAPYTGYIVLAFLAGVLVLMAFDSPVGTWTIASITLLVPALILGWKGSRKRIRDAAIEGNSPAGRD